MAHAMEMLVDASTTIIADDLARGRRPSVRDTTPDEYRELLHSILRDGVRVGPKEVIDEGQVRAIAVIMVLYLQDGWRELSPSEAFHSAPALGVAMAKPTEGEWCEQANQYLGSGIDVIWLVLPERQALYVADITFGKSFRLHEQLAPHQLLPGLAPKVSDFFRQLETRPWASGPPGRRERR